MNTITNPTSKQKKQLRELLGTGLVHGINIALGEIDHEGLAHALNQHADELRASVIETVTSKIRQFSVSNRFANEEVPSSCGYLSGYCKPKGITEQCNMLHQIFPGICFADEMLAEQPVPTGAEGWFAIPKWQTIAPTYGEAVRKVLNALKAVHGRQFYDYTEKTQLGPARLRQNQKTVLKFEQLCEEQPNHDILVVAAQFGLRHRGRSVRRAREVMNSQEFGLGAFAVGSMLLTHPERLQQQNDLGIDCVGDEYNDPDDDSDFSRVPCFSWHNGELEFAAWSIGRTYALYGAASGSLPQS